MFTQGYKEQPYWWDQTAVSTQEEVELPKKVDVLIIGAGYTGLHAAIQTARGSRNTLVIDAEHAGWGGVVQETVGKSAPALNPVFLSLKKNMVRTWLSLFIPKVNRHYSLLGTSSERKVLIVVTMWLGVSMQHTMSLSMKN